MSRAAHATPLTSRHPCSGAVLRPPPPRQRVPSVRARPRTDAEFRAGHRCTTPADRLHLGSLIDSRRGRGREVRCLAAGDLRLHPPLSPSRVRRKLRAEQPRKVGSGLLGSGEFSPLLRAVITLLPRPGVLRVDGGWGLVRAWLAQSLSPSVLLSSGLRVLSGGPLRSREIAGSRRAGDIFEHRPLVFLEIEAEPAGGKAVVAVRLLPRHQCRQLERLVDRHAADLSRGHLGEHEVVVFQRPPKDGSRMTLRGRRSPPGRDGLESLELEREWA
jgi:hypothetical protein